VRRTAWVLALLAVTAGCARYTVPDLSFSDPDYAISMTSTVNGKAPGPKGALHKKTHYSFWVWGLFKGKEFHLEHFLKGWMGPNRVVTNLRVKTYYSWWQILANMGSLFLYEARTVEVTGHLSRAVPR
jgi:hypothetical protein